jgi:PST family polysaccharide transporter
MMAEDRKSIVVRATQGYQATLLSQTLRVACKAISVVVMARLVSPADHGLFAMAASLTTILLLFRDLGLGAAALQAPTLSKEQDASVWWAHVVLGLVLCAATLAFAAATADFYGEPALTRVLVVMSPSMILIGLSAWPRTWLTRELRITELNRIETIAAVVATVAMIAAGWFGAGAYSFAVFLLVSEAVILFEVWRVSGWRPRARFRWQSLQPLFSPGFNLTGHGVLTYFQQQTDLLLMGRWFGAHALGTYARPSQLLFLAQTHVTAPLSQVLLSSLSRLGRGSQEFASHARGTINLIAHLTLPLAAICIAQPWIVVRILLGADWDEAAPLLRWLAVAAMTSYLTAAVYPIAVASGHSRRLVIMAGVSLPLLVIGMVIGRANGPVGLAAALALTNLILLLPRLWWATHDTPLRLGDFFAALHRPLLASTALAVGMTAGSLLAAQAHWMFQAGISFATGLIAFAATAFLWPQLRAELHTVWRHRPGGRVILEPAMLP